MSNKMFFVAGIKDTATLKEYIEAIARRVKEGLISFNF